ncbi:WD40-repeat-containing domain protein [Blastocladiella britannica]|nr:WD40-repeat-containing domain protein [Blastocladiella britannica]
MSHRDRPPLDAGGPPTQQPGRRNDHARSRSVSRSRSRSQSQSRSRSRSRSRTPSPPRDQAALDAAKAEHESAQRRALESRRAAKNFMRRTVDYYSGLILLRQAQERVVPAARRGRNGVGIPYAQPDVEHLLNLYPPRAYPSAPLSSATTRFIHTSMNKIRTYVNVLRWMPDGRRLITGSASGEFTLWNGLTFNFETILQAHEQSIRSMWWSHAGSYMLSGDNVGLLKYWTSNMNNLKSVQVHKEAVRGISFCPTDAKFATCSDDKTVKIWSFHLGTCETTLLGHGWDVKCLDWHPYMGMVASGAKDNQVKLWDPRAGKSITTLHGHKNTVHAVTWNRNGNWLLSGSRDGTIKLFDVRTMKEVANFRGHPKEVCSVSWHPIHESMFTSGGSDGSLLWWDASLYPSVRTPLAALGTAHDTNIWAMDWHPMGHALATGSNDHATRFWTRARPGEPEFAREVFPDYPPPDPALQLPEINDELEEVRGGGGGGGGGGRGGYGGRMGGGGGGHTKDLSSDLASRGTSASGGGGGAYIPGFGTLGLFSSAATAAASAATAAPTAARGGSPGLGMSAAMSAPPMTAAASSLMSDNRAPSPMVPGDDGGAGNRSPAVTAWRNAAAAGGGGGGGGGANAPREPDGDREEARRRRREMFDDVFGPRRRGPVSRGAMAAGAPPPPSADATETDGASSTPPPAT